MVILTGCGEKVEQVEERKSGDTQDEVIVYVTETGKKYHRSNCRHLKYSKIEKTLEDAKAEGYEACKVCKPGE